MKKTHVMVVIAATIMALGGFMTSGAIAAESEEDALRLCCIGMLYK